jgi:mycofactocin system glycosyltransferase
MGVTEPVARRQLVLDGTCRRLDGGRVLVGGSPLTLFRLSPGGARVADALEAGRPLPRGHERLTDRLLDAGAAHPRLVALAAPDELARVTVVVPAYRPAPRVLDGCLAALAASGVPPERIVVVDDASPEPVAVPAGSEGVTLVRRSVNGGPAAARMSGIERVRTDLVAFVDTDVTVEPDWLRTLLPHLDDPRVALASPRVRATPGPTFLARYEEERSPLDLGPTPGRVRAGTRVSYVPSAALLCRVEALREAGGFDTLLRVGEDVDLVWRLDEAGWRCRYEPAATAWHDSRPTWRSWLAQRALYGSSAAALDRRHPGAVAPVRASGWSAAVWGLMAAGHPLAATGVGVGTTAALVRKLPDMPERAGEAVRLAGLGHVHAGRILAGGLTRAWWPVAIAAAFVSRRAQRALVAAVVLPSLLESRRRGPAIGVFRWVGLRALDDAAYGWGLWRGVRRARAVGALLPDLSSWPNARARLGRRRPRVPAAPLSASPPAASVASGAP